MTSNMFIDKDEKGIDFDITGYQASLKDSHFETMKRILRYLNGTFHHSLWYPKSSACRLIGYSGSDFMGCKSDRKSTSGINNLFGSCLVSWHSKKQHNVAFSTAEAEYVATYSCCAQVLWLKRQLSDYDLNLVAFRLSAIILGCIVRSNVTLLFLPPRLNM
ncbi:secreted RxLR effector protein 161-like [Lathyrus oleraceus]|uniref:secreted RxLR effector protein 161-like n=1 Tax=Pisum sativum TaxID=3888 RepID=UPI0021D3BA76|nr:secreted RxLR effector protein 161-like [Pisum sativum]